MYKILCYVLPSQTHVIQIVECKKKRKEILYGA